MGQGILEEAFRSQTSERGHLGESIGEVRDQTPGKTLMVAFARGIWKGHL